jgi:hypothetical protein
MLAMMVHAKIVARCNKLVQEKKNTRFPMIEKIDTSTPCSAGPLSSIIKKDIPAVL